MNKKEIKQKMKTTWQIENKLSVLDHGIMVCDKTNKLIEIIKNKRESRDFIIPYCIVENSDYILENLVDKRTLMLYAVYHDCGKPFCIPDH